MNFEITLLVEFNPILISYTENENRVASFRDWLMIERAYDRPGQFRDNFQADVKSDTFAPEN